MLQRATHANWVARTEDITTK